MMRGAIVKTVFVLIAGVTILTAGARADEPLRIRFSDEEIKRVSMRNVGLVNNGVFASNPSADVDEHIRTKMTGACLVEAGAGEVWINDQPIVPLGMWATCASDYTVDYRLSPELQRRLAPLTNHFAQRAHRGLTGGRVESLLPRPMEDTDPLILVDLELDARLVEQSPVKHPPGSPVSTTRLVYEATAATPLAVEFISHESREAWKRLDGILDEIVTETLKPPGEGKRQRLQELIDEGGRILAALASPETPEDWKETVRGINPEAKVVTRFIQEKARTWGSAFSECSRRLRIKPATQIPSEIPRLPAARRDAEAERPSHVTFEELGLVAGVVTDDMMAEKLILGGIAINEVLPGGQDTGLQAGDIILTCTRIYDVVMGSGLSGFYGINRDPDTLRRALEYCVEKAPRYGQDVDVLRGDEVIKLHGSEGGKDAGMTERMRE